MSFSTETERVPPSPVDSGLAVTNEFASWLHHVPCTPPLASHLSFMVSFCRVHGGGTAPNTGEQEIWCQVGLVGILVPLFLSPGSLGGSHHSPSSSEKWVHLQRHCED